MNIVVGRSGVIADALLQKSQYRVTSSSDIEGVVKLDLRTPEKFDYGVIESGDLVILLAAISSPDECSRNYDNAYAINVKGSAYFSEQVLKRGGRVLFSSSDVVYGASSGDSFNELSETHGVGEYARMKLEMENLFNGEDSFKVLRLSYVLSPKDRFLSYLNACKKNKSIAEIFHPFYRNVIVIDDVVDAITSLESKWHQFSPSVVNVCGDHRVSRKDLVELYNRFSSEPVEYKVVEAPDEFWVSRPKSIDVSSLYLEDLIGRPLSSVDSYVEKNWSN